MTRHPPPPRPATRLARLLDRLCVDLQRVPIDPDFGRRVEARIRADAARLLPERRRSIPGWAAVAAGVLLTLGAGLSPTSAPAPLDRGAQLPLAPPPPREDAPDPPPLVAADEPREAER